MTNCCSKNIFCVRTVFTEDNKILLKPLHTDCFSIFIIVLDSTSVDFIVDE